MGIRLPGIPVLLDFERKWLERGIVYAATIAVADAISGLAEYGLTGIVTRSKQNSMYHTMAVPKCR